MDAEFAVADEVVVDGGLSHEGNNGTYGERFGDLLSPEVDLEGISEGQEK